MSNTHPTHRLWRYLTAGFVLFGIFALLRAGATYLSASVSSGGLSSVTAEVIEQNIAMAVTAESDAVMRLILGMLLILAGFGFYALGIVRAERTAMLHMPRRKRPARRKLLRRIHPTLRRRMA